MPASCAKDDSFGGTSTATVTIKVVAPHSSFVLGDEHVALQESYLYSRPTVSGIPAGRHATVTVTVADFQDWVNNSIALTAACGSWTGSDTLTLVCHLGSADNGLQLGHFDAHASAIRLSATADDFDAADASATLAPRAPASPAFAAPARVRIASPTPTATQQPTHQPTLEPIPQPTPEPTASPQHTPPTTDPDSTPLDPVIDGLPFG